MARLVTSGFEFNDLANGAVVNHPDPVVAVGAGSTLSSANPRTGGFHGRSVWTITATYFTVTVAQVNVVTYWARAAFYLSNLPAGTPATDYYTLLELRTAGAVSIASLRVQPTGEITFVNSAGAVDTGAIVTAGQYFVLELKHEIDTGNAANDLFEVFVNGASVYSTTGNGGTTVGALWRFGVASSSGSPGNVTVDVDDIAINDETGGAQNSSTGKGKIVLLKPISDNAGGTGWRLGTNAALGGNGFGSVDNTPSLGVADLAVGSDPKQIRNATANANDSFDANLTTYTNAGIAAPDTVNVLLPIVLTAAPVTTSSKQGTIGIASNPAITNVALSATGTPGAFWQGSTAGTYPNGWKWSFGTTTYAPAVTKANAPVARITQVTSSTRIAMVSFLGMYVDYTPVSASLTPSPPFRQSSTLYNL